MASLDALPTEILKHIFEFTPAYTHKKLLTTCRRFNAIATPIYYRDIFLYTDAKDEKKANSMIAKFFRTVRNNRTIAHSVRKICVCGSRPQTFKIEFTSEEIDDEEEKRDAEIEDDWIFEELPRPKSEMHQSEKKQIQQICDPDTVIAVMIARLKNLEHLNFAHGIWTDSRALPILFMKRSLEKLKEVRFDTEPLAPLLEGTLYPIYTPGPTDWDTISPYSPKSIVRIDLRSLLSHPHMESITCVAADRKYTNIFVDLNAEDMGSENTNEEGLNEGDMDEENMNAGDMDSEDMGSEDMNEGDLNEEDLDGEGSNERGLIEQVLKEEEEDLDEDEEFGPIEQPCKNLTSLSFERSRLSQSTLGKILDAAPRLQKLKYEFWIHTTVMGEFMKYLDCEKMDTILQPVRDTLQELSINIDYVETFAQGFTRQLGRPIIWGGLGTMRSLATFPQLTRVKIPHVFLLGWSATESQTRLIDVLPRSLKSLVILTKKLYYFQSYKWNHGAIFGRLYDLVINKNTHAPVLERIEVRGFGTRHDHKSQYAQLRRACEKNGVRISTGDSDDYYDYSFGFNY